MPAAKPNTKKEAPRLTREFSAGGVILHGKGKDQKVLLIKDSYGRWSLPKGHIEKGETTAQAGLRECSDETGIPLKDLSIVEKLGDVKYIYQLHGKKIFKIVVFFLIESKTTALKHQWEVQDAQWFEPDEAYGKMEYANSKELMRKAIQKIKNL